MTVVDASAALAFLQGEPGAEVVREHLFGSVIGAANLSEVLARMEGRVERSLAEGILLSAGVTVETVTAEDAREAAALRDKQPSLSLGDRLCLALAKRFPGPVLTADRAWGDEDGILQIRR